MVYGKRLSSIELEQLIIVVYKCDEMMVHLFARMGVGLTFQGQLLMRLSERRIAFQQFSALFRSEAASCVEVLPQDAIIFDFDAGG